MTSIDSKIRELDTPGREKMKLLCSQLGWEYSEPDSLRLAFDCFVTINNRKYQPEGLQAGRYVVELKNRSPKYEQYDEYILEKDKYERIMSWKHRLQAAGALYCNFFGNTAYIFNLDNPDITTRPAKAYMNDVTARSRSYKVQKDVYYINKSLAKKVTLNGQAVE